MFLLTENGKIRINPNEEIKFLKSVEKHIIDVFREDKKGYVFIMEKGISITLVYWSNNKQAMIYFIRRVKSAIRNIRKEFY